MRSLIIIIVLQLLVTFTSAQPNNKILDVINPIKEYDQIELSDGTVALEIQFHFIPKLGISAHSFIIPFSATIEWEDGQVEKIFPKKYWLGDKFIIEMLTSSRIEIKNYNSAKKWKKIKIKQFNIKAEYPDSVIIKKEFPMFALYPQIPKTPTITPSFEEGYIISHNPNNQIVLKISVFPKDRTYQLINLEIENNEKLSSKFTPLNIFSQQGGFIKVPLNLQFAPKIEAYKLKGNIKDIRSGKNIPFSGSVTLKDNRVLQTLEVKAFPNFYIKDNDKIKIQVPTVGKGDLKLKIASTTTNIIVTPNKVGENFYTFTLSNLLKEKTQEINFFFEANGERFKETYTINKVIPPVSNLDIENIEDKTKCKIEFQLPNWISKNRLKVVLGDDVLLKGNNFETDIIGDITTYKVVFGNVLQQGKIVEDVVKLPFYITLDDTPISTKIQVKFVNKKLIELIKTNLEKEAQKPKNQRDQEKIKEWITKAKDVGIALGQSLDEGDLKMAIDGMNEPNKSKAQKTVKDIITWVTAIAGIVLMII